MIYGDAYPLLFAINTAIPRSFYTTPHFQIRDVMYRVCKYNKHRILGRTRLMLDDAGSIYELAGKENIRLRKDNTPLPSI